MIILLVFAFLAGVVTILSPCILPILPIILSATVDSSGYRRPLGIVTGFVLSFTFFTLFLSSIVGYLGIPAEFLRTLSIAVLALFGLSLMTPRVQHLLEQLFSRLGAFTSRTTGRSGFGGGVVIGLSLGLLWTPCVGPILASVISLALTGEVSGQAFLITLAYSVGTAIPMFGITLAGSHALQRVPWLVKNGQRVQRSFGVVMIATALAIFFNLDRSFQTYVLTKFPKYGIGLTSIEDNAAVQDELTRLDSSPVPELERGKPMPPIARVKGPVAAELIPGGEWFNSPPLTLSDQKGKVVLIDFWTYTCINCIRTLPYLKSWHSKYADQGLVIIGVHSPEFEFEKDANNVQQAIDDFGITYPVVQDNNFTTWRAYSNRYWPAKYLIDQDGYVRYTHIGEGDYDETEGAIRELLEEAGARVEGEVKNAGYTNYARTPETYLGKARRQYNADLNLIGDWHFGQEYAVPSAGDALIYKYEAKSVYLVMRSKNGEPTKIKVLLDGVEHKEVVVTKDTLYTLIDLDTPGRHTLKLEFEDDNIELYAFTFG